MNRKYAEGTEVSEARSVAEIRKALATFGATGWRYIEDEASLRHAVQFVAGGLRIQLLLQLPAPDEPRFKYPDPSQPWYRPRTALQAKAAWEQECRRLWRGLVMIVKAKLIAITDGIRTVQEEFEPDILLPGGLRMGDVADALIRYEAEHGRLPDALQASGLLALPPGPEHRK